MRRTPKQITAFRERILSAIPSATDPPVGIGDVAERAGVIGVRRKWTRVKRRHVNEALAKLCQLGEIEVSGAGRATQYRQVTKPE